MYDTLQADTGYKFKNEKLLIRALTHSSFANENRDICEKHENNERLEFLGDSVLSLVITTYLFKTHPEMKEGELTRMRASIVCERALAEAAKSVDIGSCLRLGKGEELSGGRERDAVLADAFEAVLAAVYLDGGMKNASAWVHKMLDGTIKQVCSGGKYIDYKTLLQEQTQKGNDGKVTYRVVSQTGPAHKAVFETEVLIDGVVWGIGVGDSKKEAEQTAAKQAMDKLNK